MTLYQTPDASLTYHPDTATLRLSYNALSLAVGFEQAYQHALETMQEQQVPKLLLDLKRNAPPTDDADYWLLAPLIRQLAKPLPQPIFIAAVVSEGQYQYQIGNSLAARSLPPPEVEFNYFTSRREAAAWLSTN
ncbi:hypothetical protein [Hymenobacter cavernae]|uniref:STAS/SEC14 domain-containing protein n=1 Tax=Hymenobacter cavernae TaxID=2044852 RepID=A0ABQ1TV28_9BACT|nr:hypothetical protein [Hymenobacter cavernae]GGF02906.1 hypothetical protein GCM10011383_12280 [Hymenobacter cavernae]